tara:strand:- start:700 stop:1281 length:582 start_codon:yes stop_codon:yes gene_type:complete
MDAFWFYFKLGFDHVLDIGGLDHFYFLIVLSLPFMFREWRKLLLWVSIFTLGHTLSLLVTHFEWIQIDGKWVEFLIPVTIGVSCLSVLITNKKTVYKGRWINVITLFFGTIHGFGFGRYFKMITIADEKAIVSLLEFAVGVEFAQIVIVLAMLLVNLLGIGILGLRKEKWQWVIAAMVLSQALLMTIENWPAI